MITICSLHDSILDYSNKIKESISLLDIKIDEGRTNLGLSATFLDSLIEEIEDYMRYINSYTAQAKEAGMRMEAGLESKKFRIIGQEEYIKELEDRITYLEADIIRLI